MTLYGNLLRFISRKKYKNTTICSTNMKMNSRLTHERFERKPRSYALSRRCGSGASWGHRTPRCLRTSHHTPSWGAQTRGCWEEGMDTPTRGTSEGKQVETTH